MRTIPAAISTLLASRSMLGANAPAYAVTVTGMPTGGGARELTNGVTGTEANKVILGYSAASNDNWGNFVATNDGKYMAPYIDDTTKEVIIAYCADESFLTTDHACTSIAATGITVVSINNGGAAPTGGHGPVSLFKRDDNKVLLFVTDRGNTSTTAATVKCYLSTTGNGDDFAYLSTVRTVTIPSTLSSCATAANIPLQIDIVGGTRLVLSVAHGYHTSGTVFKRAHIYTSDDDGATWTLRHSLTAIGVYNSISQIAQLPSGTLYTEVTHDGGHAYVYKSVDDGESWSYSGSNFNVGSIYCGAFYYDIGTGLAYRVVTATGTSDGIYTLENPTDARFEVQANWQLVCGINSNASCPAKIYETALGALGISWPDSTARTVIIGYDAAPLIPINVKSININRSKGAASQATIVLDNKAGIYAPDSTGDWTGVFMPNVEVHVDQGYGTELIRTFTGLIDSVDMNADPSGQTITIECRDMYKWALDKTITDGTSHVITYSAKTVEYIADDLAKKAGWAAGDITTEVTGITLTEKTFSWESYADCFAWLAELAGFEVYADEDGDFHFVKDVKPAVPTTEYEFAEGVDIIKMGYRIDDRDLYYSAVVHGAQETDTTVYSAEVAFGAPLTYNVFADKIMKINASDADSDAKCLTIATRAAYLMECRCRVVDFAAVAVPWAQIGDFIRVTETSSTISEIYRITDMSLQQDIGGFVMQIVCFFYANA